MALVYCLLYTLSCMTKFTSILPFLFLGRILSGASTCLLFCVFEAWLVTTHRERGFDEASLKEVFSRGSVLNSAGAVLAGLVAGAAADAGGNAAPYAVAAAALVSCAVMIALWFTENRGAGRAAPVSAVAAGKEQETSKPAAAAASQQQPPRCQVSLMDGLHAVLSSRRIMLLGLAQSLFEGSMYSFVFAYTPALEGASPAGAIVPFGTVFACFMVSVMIGSTLQRGPLGQYDPHLVLCCVFVAAAASLSVALFAPASLLAVALSLCGFELCCGVYFACQAGLRAKIIPDAQRASVLALFRVPLNIFVLVVITNVKDGGVGAVLRCCIAGLASATVINAINWRMADKNTTKAI